MPKSKVIEIYISGLSKYYPPHTYAEAIWRPLDRREHEGGLHEHETFS